VSVKSLEDEWMDELASRDLKMFAKVTLLTNQKSENKEGWLQIAETDHFKSPKGTEELDV
jgi:hypothetical protein